MEGYSLRVVGSKRVASSFFRIARVGSAVYESKQVGFLKIDVRSATKTQVFDLVLYSRPFVNSFSSSRVAGEYLCWPASVTIAQYGMTSNRCSIKDMLFATTSSRTETLPDDVIRLDYKSLVHVRTHVTDITSKVLDGNRWTLLGV